MDCEIGNVIPFHQFIHGDAIFLSDEPDGFTSLDGMGCESGIGCFCWLFENKDFAGVDGKVGDRKSVV